MTMSLLLGSRCVSCKRAGPLLCSTCLTAISTGSRPGLALHGTPVRALGWYRGELRSLIRAAKNFGARAVLTLLRREIRGLFDVEAGVTVVPIPPSRPGFQRRGYGLAACVARASGLPVNDCLTLVDTGTQRGRTIADRHRRRRVWVRRAPPRRAVLVDDVLTTGATARAAIDALTVHGCDVVAVVVLAAVARE